MATKEEAAEVRKKNSAFLLGLPGVVGVGVTQDDSNDSHSYRLIVHVETDDKDLYQRMRDRVAGCPVTIVRSGRYRKL